MGQYFLPVFLNTAGTIVHALEPTDYGFLYTGIRSRGDQDFVRVYHYVMPVTQIRGQNIAFDPEILTINGHFWVPVDDEHTATYNFMYSDNPSVPLTERFIERPGIRFSKAASLPNQISLPASSRLSVSSEKRGNVPAGGFQTTPFLNVNEKFLLASEPLLACSGVAFHGPLGCLSPLKYPSSIGSE